MNHTEKIISAALGCAAAMLVATSSSLASNHKCAEPYRLGGAYVVTVPIERSDGSTHTIRLTGLQIPLDAWGRTAATRLEFLGVDPEFEALGELLGVSMSEAVGHTEMTGRNTARFTCVAYGISRTEPKEVRLILTMRAELQFETPDRIRVQDNVTVYLTNSGLDLVAPVVGMPWPYGDADADHDLLPDEGAIPFIKTTTGWGFAKRIPMLP